jgi:signal transduction histidine kinase
MAAHARRAGDETPDNASGQFRDSLVAKITLPALALVIVPVLIVGVLGAVSLFALADRIDGEIDRATDEVVSSELGPARAEQAAVFQQGVETYVTARIDDVIDLAQAAEVIDLAAAAPPADEDEAAPSENEDEAGDQPEQPVDRGEADALAAFLQAAAAQQPALLTIEVTGASGELLASTDPTDDTDRQDLKWRTMAAEAGAYVGSPTFDPIRDTVVIDVAVRVAAPGGESDGGVIHAIVDGGVFETMADDLVARGPTGLQVLALSAQNVLLSETATEHQRDRIGQQVSLDEGRTAIYSDAIAASGTAEDAVTSTFLVLSDRVTGASASPPTRSIDRLDLVIASEPWVAIVEQPAGSARGPFQGFWDFRSDMRVSALALALAALMVLVLAAGLAYLVMITVARRIIGTVADLRGQAEDLAHGELEAYVDYGHSSASDLLALEADPIEIESRSELAGLAQSFNDVRTAAMHLVASESLRSSGEAIEMVARIGRRFATWSHEQNNLIETILADPSRQGPQRLLRQLQQSNFILNREANGLLVLGREPLAVSPRPVPLDELLRVAAASVAEQHRVEVLRVDAVEIEAEIANDLRLLLAELIDNATSYSPSEERVEVFAIAEPDESVTISIVDRGPGLEGEELREVNALIAAAGTSNRIAGGFGLLIVGRLAARGGLDVYLLESPPGTTARVIVPRHRLINPTDPSQPTQTTPPAAIESGETDDELTRALRSAAEQVTRD